MSDTPAAAVNGVDVGNLLATVAAIKAQPSLADFKFRAEADWRDGGHSRTRIQRFYGAGSEDASRGAPFVLENTQEFTLVPWRPVIERSLGREVVGIVTDGGVSWQIRREAGAGALIMQRRAPGIERCSNS